MGRFARRRINSASGCRPTPNVPKDGIAQSHTDRAAGAKRSVQRSIRIESTCKDGTTGLKVGCRTNNEDFGVRLQRQPAEIHVGNCDCPGGSKCRINRSAGQEPRDCDANAGQEKRGAGQYFAIALQRQGDDSTCHPGNCGDLAAGPKGWIGRPIG